MEGEGRPETSRMTRKSAAPGGGACLAGGTVRGGGSEGCGPSIGEEWGVEGALGGGYVRDKWSGRVSERER